MLIVLRAILFVGDMLVQGHSGNLSQKERCQWATAPTKDAQAQRIGGWKCIGDEETSLTSRSQRTPTFHVSGLILAVAAMNSDQPVARQAKLAYLDRSKGLTEPRYETV